MLKQSDVTIFRGMSKEIADYRETHGDEPLWTNGMFSGMPSYQISTKYPNNWIRKIDKMIGWVYPDQLIICGSIL